MKNYSQAQQFDQGFFAGKKVFVTGHTGFKGSWLCLWLRQLGAEVTGYALESPTEPNLFGLCRVGELVHSVTGDVRDGERLSATMAAAAPEIVLHLAAQPLVRDSYKLPVETFEINVMGTVNLLQAVRLCKSVKSVVIITTDKCYENKEWHWGYRETEPMGGYDPYSASKGCSELVSAAFRHSFFNPGQYAEHGVGLATARAGNVIGGGDWAADRLIPDSIRALLAGEQILVRNPHAIRPWQHVLEPLSGYLLLAQQLYLQGGKYASGWNLGPSDDDARPVEWIVRKMCEKWGEGAGYLLDDGDHPHEAHYLKLDCSKAAGELGWRPRWNLETALDKIVTWARAYRAGEDIRQVCCAQISEYTQSMEE